MSLLIKDLTKKFDEHVAVNNLNIEIPKGEMFGFLGGMEQVKRLHFE